MNQLLHDNINSLIIHLENKSRFKRRNLISNLNEYIKEIMNNLELCESVYFTFMKEIIEDTQFTEKEYIGYNQVVMQRDQDFLFQMGVLNEKNRIMQSPEPQKYVYLKQAISFFEKKILVLERVQKDKLFKSILNLNISLIGIILQNYITDLVVIETKIEEFDISRRADLIKNSEIQRLNKEFMEKFSIFLDQLRIN